MPYKKRRWSCYNKFEKSFEDNNIFLKVKLAETGLFPITHRFDRNLIFLAWEGIKKRWQFLEIYLKYYRLGWRNSPFAEVLIQKQKKRPLFAKAFLDKGI